MESLLNQQNPAKMPSMIQPAEGNELSFFGENSKSFVFPMEEGPPHAMNKEGLDEYHDDDDPGFEIYVVNEENFVASCKELAEEKNFPARAIAPDTKEAHAEREKKLRASQPQRKDDSAVMLQKLQGKGKGNVDGDDELANS